MNRGADHSSSHAALGIRPRAFIDVAALRRGLRSISEPEALSRPPADHRWSCRCGDGTQTSTGSSPTPSATPSGAVATIAAQVPGSVKANGALTIAADATYAPNEFIAPDGRTVIGFDADLSKALGQVLGLKVNLTNATFDTIIPGLASGKYHLGISSFTDTKEREQTVDFVTYFVAGTSFYVKSSGGPDIKSLADLCRTHRRGGKGTTGRRTRRAVGKVQVGG